MTDHKQMIYENEFFDWLEKHEAGYNLNDLHCQYAEKYIKNLYECRSNDYCEHRIEFGRGYFCRRELIREEE